MAFLNDVEGWRLLVVGFLFGIGATLIGVWIVAQWAGARAYIPGPFARPDLEEHYRLAPPRPEDAA
jgi:hypothetical protein